ncbi:MAG: hypothetical protein IE913_00235 [Halothiobacillus sp.]|nr:hypothetical protein [Halothiobacillus sp.]
MKLSDAIKEVTANRDRKTDDTEYIAITTEKGAAGMDISLAGSGGSLTQMAYALLRTLPEDIAWTAVGLYVGDAIKSSMADNEAAPTVIQ